MIIGENRTAVIENIERAAESGDFYAKVELKDPMLTKKQSDGILNRFIERRNKPIFRLKSAVACKTADILMGIINRDTEIVGGEKLTGIRGGVIITSNHFSPLENTAVRYLARKKLHKKLAIVSQVSNFAMGGFVGYLMNYANIIPLSDNVRYMSRPFLGVLREKLNKGQAVLIYPEQEMWFNYRKPRPPKRGAYLFAAKLKVPIVSCFVELIDLPKAENVEFNKVKYRIHVLDILTSDSKLSDRDNSVYMSDRDYELKKSAYERIYGKKLDYRFEPWDIAGWKNE